MMRHHKAGEVPSEAGSTTGHHSNNLQPGCMIAGRHKDEVVEGQDAMRGNEQTCTVDGV